MPICCNEDGTLFWVECDICRFKGRPSLTTIEDAKQLAYKSGLNFYRYDDGSAKWICKFCSASSMSSRPPREAARVRKQALVLAYGDRELFKELDEVEIFEHSIPAMLRFRTKFGIETTYIPRK